MINYMYLYPTKDAVELKDPDGKSLHLKMDIIEQVKSHGEEWAYLNLLHYGTNRPVFSGWLKGPDYQVRLTWLA